MRSSDGGQRSCPNSLLSPTPGYEPLFCVSSAITICTHIATCMTPIPTHTLILQSPHSFSPTSSYTHDHHIQVPTFTTHPPPPISTSYSQYLTSHPLTQVLPPHTHTITLSPPPTSWVCTTCLSTTSPSMAIRIRRKRSTVQREPD